MSLTITLPQARIPIGWAIVKGQRIPVEIDMEWMLAMMRLVERTGGTSGDANFTEYVNQFFDALPVDPGLREAVRAIDELRNSQDRGQDPQLHELANAVDELRIELAASRSDTQALRGLIEELIAASAAPAQNEQLRSRVQSLEDRLA